MRVNCTVDEHFLHLLVLEGHAFRFIETGGKDQTEALLVIIQGKIRESPVFL